MAFAIDGTSRKQYASIEWTPPYIDTQLDGSLNYGIYWKCVLTWATITADEWQAILNECIDTATHTIALPDPTTNNTETTYSNVRLRPVAMEYGRGLYVYNPQVEVTRVLVT